MITDYFTKTFTVESQTTASSVSAIGAYSPTYGTLGTFKGFIDYLSGGERGIANQYIDKATHIIGCPSTCTWIYPRHRIKDADSNIYRILNIDNPIGRSHHLEILLEYHKSDNLST